eukprot:12045781-Alexandrium_andersonii.AAC.1
MSASCAQPRSRPPMVASHEGRQEAEPSSIAVPALVQQASGAAEAGATGDDHRRSPPAARSGT